MMYIGSTLPVLPIIEWDEKLIVDVEVLTMALSDLVREDMVAGPETHRIKVPYV
ncbi:putative aminodeoxychorismate lyase, D-amino-acid transaminase [Helianthus debilis subsp. tardiflorus]|nr:putative aminodeoxychorismate lyase, D-amino-acid transaminase [Helianthus annuus]